MNKTIYVSEDDFPIFEHAQQLFGGNLSGAIAHAIRLFVDTHADPEPPYEEITVVVGPPGRRRRQRFWGRHVADWRHLESQAGVALAFSVYVTRHQRWALYRRHASYALHELPFFAHHSLPLDTPLLPTDAPRLEVYDHLAELKQVIPSELADLLDSRADELPLDDLDI